MGYMIFQKLCELREELKKDPTILSFGVIDAAILTGDCIKEKYEGLYMKIWDMTNILMEKGGSPGSLTLTAGRYISLIFECSHTRCFCPSADWETKRGKFDLGILNNKWHHFLDDDMPANRIEIGSDKGKFLLLIDNMDELQKKEFYEY